MGIVKMVGGNPTMQAPITGILVGDLAVGSTVKLIENGSPVDYLVVNQGIPSNSTLYDNSCNGTWLLRKELCPDAMVWNNVADGNYYWNIYEGSTVDTYLTDTYFPTLGSVEHSTIKTVKIPYIDGVARDNPVLTGANGLPRKVFLLSSIEVGFYAENDMSGIITDGAKLDYFSLANGSEGCKECIAYLNGVAQPHWLRSPDSNNNSNADAIDENGLHGTYGVNNTKSGNVYYVRPALVLPSNAVFDEKTMILKGVA